MHVVRFDWELRGCELYLYVACVVCLRADLIVLVINFRPKKEPSVDKPRRLLELAMMLAPTKK